MKKIILFLLFLSVFINSQYFEERISGTTNSLNSGSCGYTSGFASVTAWVCGNNGTVIKTMNSGYNWVSRNGSLPANINLYAIDGFDTSFAVAAGNIGTTTYVYRTTNGGYNWSQVFTQANGRINAIHFRKSLIGFMSGNPVGGRWSLWKTTNRGVTWDSAGLRLPQAGSESGFSNSMVVKGDSIWLGTNNSRIYYSSNYGNNWTAQNTSIQNINSIFFLLFNNPWEGYAGGNNLIKTTNVGVNWTAMTSGGTGNIVGIAEGNPGVYQNPTIGIFLARGTTIAYQIFSFPWAYYNAPAGSYNYMFKPKHRDTTWYGLGGSLYAIRNNGGITDCGCAWGAVRRLGTEIPIDFGLSQNYPNPFNPVTSFRFDNPILTHVRIVIYDLMGRITDILTDEKLPPGIYEVQWDASKFSSGVYYYSLQAGGFTQTKKMALVR